MSKTNYSFSKQTMVALEHFSGLLSVARKNKSMTVVELSDKLGVSRTTATSMLKGSPTVNIGLYFEAARILGVSLFDQEPSRLEVSKRKTQQVESLLPKRVRVKKRELDNDF
ncbi:helix-turn-helix domain-containing protein [Vibrio sp. JC009]|uniref:helix-turn-helix transcriptional regulator n=1 Tax=Vibrio sp. JC009 TaxID=2912314 RepID=UPI0023B03C04|nr:helix-turn-helix transcriptional regulator [Vibrio sp. JC009]WED21977.1 helix-turn-helix domain-containing protein [Vibrio sp. JC009]